MHWDCRHVHNDYFIWHWAPTPGFCAYYVRHSTNGATTWVGLNYYEQQVSCGMVLFAIALSWFSQLLTPLALLSGEQEQLWRPGCPTIPQMGPLDPACFCVPLTQCPCSTSCKWGCCLPVADGCTSLPSRIFILCSALLLSEARIINLDGIPYLLGYFCSVSLPLSEGEGKQKLFFMTNSIPGAGTVCTCCHRCLPNDP